MPVCTRTHPGTHQVFVNTGVNRDNPLQLPRPEAAIVVGLGEEGKLRATDLVRTVRQAAIAWSQRLTEKSGRRAGDVRVGVDAHRQRRHGTSPSAQAAQLIAQGVREANERTGAGAGWPVVGHLLLHRAVSRSRQRGLARAAGAGRGRARRASS